jgi:hypothetical protein
LCGDRVDFDIHPPPFLKEQSYSISFGRFVLKAKNPFYADKQEESEEEKAAKKNEKNKI